MALDQTANWTIQYESIFSQAAIFFDIFSRMADNLEQVKKSWKAEPQQMHPSNSEAHTAAWTGPPINLPDELLIQILTFVSHHQNAQSTLAAATLLSRQWYAAATPFLYAHPRLYGANFDPFARAICPSINLHVRKSRLASLVQVLDLGNLVHQGSRHMTARLLGRTKHSLLYFRAPQASFGMNSLPALSKCTLLRDLDLSLVSESPPLPDLFRTISNLPALTTLRLPRSSGFGAHHATPASTFAWPPSLSDLALSGGIDAHLLHGIVSFPQTLTTLTVEHCPQIKGFALSHLLRTAVAPLPRLTTLRVAHLPRLSSHALDDVLFLLPQIRTLSISVDYVTPAMFDEGHYRHLKDPLATTETSASLQPLRHEHLHTLELTTSGNPGVEDKISPIDVMIALDDGTLPALRVVRVSKGLFWHANSTKEDAEALADVLVERSKVDWERREGVFRDMTVTEWEKGWERRAGVWSF